MARTILDFVYNRNTGVKMTPLSMSFLTGDKNGHEFHIAIVDKGGNVDLTGSTVTGYLIPDDQGRADDLTAVMVGSVEGNIAILTLSDECYMLTGRFNLVIKVVNGEDTSTVFWGTGSMLRSSTDEIIESPNVVDLNTLLALIAQIENATSAANTAATGANEAASNANSKANAAQTAATNAQNAAGKINNMMVTVSQLPEGSQPTANLTTANNAYKLALGIPKGDTGLVANGYVMRIEDRQLILRYDPNSTPPPLSIKERQLVYTIA